MNAMLSSMRCHQITKVILSLVMVALIAGLTGCVGETNRTVRYDLDIASGEGGSVTDPGEGTFTCDAGRVVDLVATQASGYRFVKWTGSVATIANPNAASTTITINGDYSITATFEETEATFYTLTVGVTGSGSTSPAVGQHTYAAGTVVTITATPASGYRFVNWTATAGSFANTSAAQTTFAMPGQDVTVTAHFELAQTYTLSVAVAPPGSGTATDETGAGPYEQGDQVSIRAQAAAGYRFVNWTATAGSFANASAAQTTFTMPGQDVTVTAHFELAQTYTLTMAVTPPGSGTATDETGAGPYEQGDQVSIRAQAAADYRFVNWTATAGSFANANAATTTFTMPAQDVTVTANFEEGPPVPPGPYSLTISSTAGGSVTVTIGGEDTAVGAGQTQTISDITAGTGVDLAASSNAGYHFVNWAGAPVNGLTSPTTTFTIQGNYSITAHFAVGTPEYDLTISSTAGGSVTVTIDGEDTVVGAGQTQTISDITAGTDVDLVASHNAGYHFVNWAGAPVNGLTNPTTTFTIQGNYSITAHFAVGTPEYDLTISSTAGGSVTVTIDGEDTAVGAGQTQTISDITAGTDVDLVASHNAGYRFVSWVGDVGTVANVRAASTTITINGNYAITALFATRFMTAAGERHTVGLKSDGTVAAVGDGSDGQRNVGSWTNIIQVAAGDSHTVGLKSDGTVLAVGANDHGQCNIGGWTDIVQIAAGAYHTVGLRSNGTVVAVGDNSYGQRNVGAWTNIVQVTAGLYHTVGLKSDGTVVAVGAVGVGEWPSYGQCDVSSWTNIIQVVAGDYHTVGLKSGGTVVAVGYNYRGQCNVGGWTNIIQVAAGAFHTVGLKAGGTVTAVGDNYDGQLDVSSWTNIIQVTAGDYHTVGLKSDGTVVAVGANWWGQCYIGGWDLN